MRVHIGDGVRIYVDVDGFGLVADDDGTKMRDRPTIIAMHGGPGFDHAGLKLGLGPLRDVAQLVLYDHRGQGRSDWRSADEWTLDTWADDLVRLCDALGIERPIVLGNSFGGFVAQRYLARHPGHASKVILYATMAQGHLDTIVDGFRTVGGDEAADAARRSGQGHRRVLVPASRRCAGRCTRRAISRLRATLSRCATTRCSHTSSQVRCGRWIIAPVSPKSTARCWC